MKSSAVWLIANSLGQWNRYDRVDHNSQSGSNCLWSCLMVGITFSYSNVLFALSVNHDQATPFHNCQWTCALSNRRRRSIQLSHTPPQPAFWYALLFSSSLTFGLWKWVRNVHATGSVRFLANQLDEPANSCISGVSRTWTDTAITLITATKNSTS